MNINQLLIKPGTISFLTTFQCTAECKNCCFGCSPKTKGKLSLEEMKLYLDQAIMHYGDGLKVLVLTGGECFLLKDDLVEIIRYGASKELVVRVVTNGFWAKTYQEAYETIHNLRENGLKEINFSTGDDHQEWVPYDNIVNGCMASMDLGLVCCVNIETHDDSKTNFKTMQADSRLTDYFNVLKFPTPLIINEGVWIPFSKDSRIS
ncbi:MAG: 4Fe-4S cluster-binding domain-containing protein [bacterium]